MFVDYLKCQYGSTAIITTFAAGALAATAGIATIMVQGNYAKSQLQASLDAAVLAGAALPGSSSDIKRVAAAQAMFDANVASLLKPAESVFESVGKPDFAVRKGIVTGRASSIVRNSLAASFGISSLTIAEDSAAKKVESDPLCVLALDPSESATIEIYGNAELRAIDCAVMANSNDGTGMKQYGSGSKASASEFGIPGGYSGQNWAPLPVTGVDPVVDPYSSMPVPVPGTCLDVSSRLKQDNFTLDPGTYCGGLEIKAGANVVLNPGVYVFKDGTLSINSGASVAGQEVLLAFVGSDSYLYMLSQAHMSITSPTTGTYINMQFMSDRDLSGSKFQKEWTTILGGATLEYDGVMYLPEQQFWMSGAAHDIIVKGNSPTLAMVVDKAWVQGNAVLEVTQENRRNLDVAPGDVTFAKGTVLIK
jgi:hypothetical protein